MPRLNHKKTRSGCQMCKARKVKCDEGKPRCSACIRHNVSCEYLYGTAGNSRRQTSAAPSTNGPYYGQPANNGVLDQGTDPLLEVRLMHEWTAYTCKTFSLTWEFWCYQAPLIALEFRYLLDAMFAMAALHASRQPPSQWVAIEGRSVPITNPAYDPMNSADSPDGYWKNIRRASVMSSITNALHESAENAYLGPKRATGMLATSRMYFDRAMEGYRQAVENLTKENIEAVFTTSCLVVFSAWFALSESAEDSIAPVVDPSVWLRLGRGCYFIIQRWKEMAGMSWIAFSGVYYGKPDLSDDEWIFAPEHAKPFEKLLSYAEDFEIISDEDRNAYQKTLTYIGLTYKCIIDGTDPPLATCRRVTAMPSKVPPRFIDLVEAKQPRAMVILAYLFASTSFIEESDVAEWFNGIAEHQIPKIYEQLPVGWREPMAWPMAVARGEISRPSKDSLLDDVPSL